MRVLNKVSRETLVIILILSFVFGSTVPLNAVTDNVGIDADASIIIDGSNGSIYSGSNVDQVHGIASITKLMTVYITYKYMEENSLQLTDTINISERAAAIKHEQPAASGLYLEANRRISYDQALNQALILSDNGIAIALAEEISGSEKEFVNLMNQTALEIGMKNSTFYNASGLSSYDYGDIQIEGIDPNTYNTSTAVDLAILGMSVIEDYPEIIERTATPEITIDGEVHQTYNLLVNPQSDFYYEGVRGFKTGFSDEAMNCFIGYYESPITGYKYVSAVLGTDSKPIVFNQTAYLYNWVDTQRYYSTLDENDEWLVDLKGVSDGSGTILIPSVQLTDTEQKYIDAAIIDYEFNGKYFDENDILVENIPQGEVVTTVVLKGFTDEPIIDNVKYIERDDSTGEYVMKIDLVSRETIAKQIVVGDVLEAIEQYFIGLYNEVI